jgi:hypothetical protein
MGTGSATTDSNWHQLQGWGLGRWCRRFAKAVMFARFWPKADKLNRYGFVLLLTPSGHVGWNVHKPALNDEELALRSVFIT